MKEEKQNFCMFCETILTNNTKSNEHVIPQWLMKELEIENETIIPTFRKARGTLISKRKHTLDELVEGKICKTCNNGWMNDLENSAKDVLIKLIHGHQEVNLLDDYCKTVLSKWIAKTVCTLNSSSNYSIKIPKEHIKLIYTNKIPDNVGIFIQQHNNDRKFFWIQSASWDVYNSIDRKTQTLLDKSYKISMQFGKLVFCVAYSNLSNWKYVLKENIHIPIYLTDNSFIIAKNKGNFTWDNSMKFLEDFHISVGLINES